MPSHFHISFGIGNYLGFKFKFGSRGNDHGGRSDSTDLIKRSGDIVHDAKTAPRAKEQPECPLFTAIPVEIRHMIYNELLIAPCIIDKAHKQLGNKETAMLEHYTPIPNIDASILRTCRLIYAEALPILYGLNVFSFCSAQSIRHFQTHGLSHYPLTFNFQVVPTGRLQLVRALVLELKSDYSRTFHRGQNLNYTRDSIWRDWSLSLFNDDRDPWGSNAISFPKLEKLTLDFTEWQLTENDGLLVKPFVKKLRPSEGLHELVLKGVKHAATTEQLKTGLVREGGTFSVINQ